MINLDDYYDWPEDIEEMVRSGKAFPVEVAVGKARLGKAFIVPDDEGHYFILADIPSYCI